MPCRGGRDSNEVPPFGRGHMDWAEMAVQTHVKQDSGGNLHTGGGVEGK